MSKYEDFVNMRTYVFLITLGFTQLVFCDHDLNITDYDLNSVCPVQFFRRKRAAAEYTRWRANQELTTNEFLVKVLDEDLPTPQMNPIIAVNILPVTKVDEKIIIGGVRVPPPTSTLVTTDALKDYTRFVAPAISTARGDREIFLAPISEGTIPPILPLLPKGNNRNSLRDDSPPASPQFLARTPMLTGRQYAPIAPVAFSRRATNSPVTPPSMIPYDQESESADLISELTESSEIVLIPTRTATPAGDFQKYNSLEETTRQQGRPEFLTRSTYSLPDRTTDELIMINDADAEIPLTTDKSIVVDGTKQEEELKKIAEKDLESSYNMMFYNDEDSNVNSKKDDQDISDNYFDKKGNYERSTEKAFANKDNEAEEYIDNRNTSSNKELHNILSGESGSDNFTDKMSSVGVIGIPGEEIAPLRKTARDSLRAKRRPFCSLLTLRQLNFNSPPTLPEIMNQLKQWAENSPVAKWVDITNGNYTTMENPIYMMIVDDPSSGQIVSAKRTVMIVAGIQGRDHHAVAAAMYVLYQLIERSEAHTDLLSKYRFWVIPVFNPDGYDYSMTFPHRREWTKNLRQLWDKCNGRDACQSCATEGLRCTIRPCYGVNLDRNFEYQWIPAEELRNEHPCGNLYSGARQLSELETRALTQFMHDQQTPVYTFIAFKEGNILGIMYPYSHTKKKRAFDHVFRQRATRAATAASSISSRQYVSGQTSEFLPLYAGGIEDWMDGHLGIDNTYTIMMFRPSDSYNSKVITERVVHEAYAAMDTLLLQSLEAGTPARVALTRSGLRSSVTTPRPTHLLIILSIIVLLRS